MCTIISLENYKNSKRHWRRRDMQCVRMGKIIINDVKKFQIYLNSWRNSTQYPKTAFCKLDKPF